jgi:hypothetical protein
MSRLALSAALPMWWEAQRTRQSNRKDGTKTMDPKLAIMFLLIASVLALSSFQGGAFERARQQIKRRVGGGR